MTETVIDNKHMILTVDITTGHPIIGLRLHERLTHNFFKYVRDVVHEDLLITLGSLGYHTAFTIVHEGHHASLRFNQLLGYEEECTVDGYVWLAQDIL